MQRRRLDIERVSKELAIGVYIATKSFPAEERHGLGRQLRRSVVSVGSNIAEGAGRSTDREFVRFLEIGLGSNRELRFQLVLAMELGLAKLEMMRSLVETSDHLNAMMQSLQRRLR